MSPVDHSLFTYFLTTLCCQIILEILFTSQFSITHFQKFGGSRENEQKFGQFRCKFLRLKNTLHAQENR